MTTTPGWRHRSGGNRLPTDRPRKARTESQRKKLATWEIRLIFAAETYTETAKKKGFPPQEGLGILSAFYRPVPFEKQYYNHTRIMAYMTQEGYDKMVAQLRHMESIERPAASAAIAEARDKGDLSENSEYDAAKEAQGMLEMKINNLKAAIAEAKIIDASKLRSDIVQILSTVEMKNTKNGMVMKYTIVSESEANLREGKISSTTPIAQGLLGRKVGDVVDVKIPQGTISLEILNITVG